jgi:hypothetical protein
MQIYLDKGGSTYSLSIMVRATPFYSASISFEFWASTIPLKDFDFVACMSEESLLYVLHRRLRYRVVFGYLSSTSTLLKKEECVPYSATHTTIYTT